MGLNEYTDNQLLKELLQRNGGLEEPSRAPVKSIRSSKHYEWIVGIGKDHIANITLSDDDLARLVGDV